MRIPTLPPQTPQTPLKIEKIFLILPTRPTTLQNLLRQRPRLLRSQKLRITRQPNVNKTLDRRAFRKLDGRRGFRNDASGRGARERRHGGCGCEC
jgi:hypothetical protein